MNYSWPGNVRELENIIQRCVIVAQGETILLKDLPPEIQAAPSAPQTAVPQVDKNVPIEPTAQDDSQNDRETLSPPYVNTNDVASHLPAPLPTKQMEAGEIFDLVYKQVREKCDTAILSRVEKELIQRALKETGGNQVKASNLLGIARVTLRKRISEHKIRY